MEHFFGTRQPRGTVRFLHVAGWSGAGVSAAGVLAFSGPGVESALLVVAGAAGAACVVRLASGSFWFPLQWWQASTEERFTPLGSRSVALAVGGVCVLLYGLLGVAPASAIALGMITAILLVTVPSGSIDLIEGADDDRLSVLHALAQAAEAHDLYTHGHCRRVASSACEVGEFLGLTDDDLFTLRWAALLHDVGKFSVPTDILLKPGPLTGEEFEQVKSHSRAGADVVAAAGVEFREIAEAICCHHERWDGTGYPTGLAGENVPLVARIIAVADVFEALTSDRPYRGALSDEAALGVLWAGAGTHFDESVVAVFELLRRRADAHSRSGIGSLTRASRSMLGGSVASLAAH